MYVNSLIDLRNFQIFNNPNVNPDIRSLKFQARTSLWPLLPIWAHWLLHTTFYSLLMVVVIIVNSVTIAIDQGTHYEWYNLFN